MWKGVSCPRCLGRGEGLALHHDRSIGWVAAPVVSRQRTQGDGAEKRGIAILHEGICQVLKILSSRFETDVAAA